MKAQKAVAGIGIGLLAAVLMRGLSMIPAAAEGTETAAITVETVVAANGTFEATVFLDELPEFGLCAVDFAIAYDPTALGISEVTLLYDTGAEAAEATVNPALAGTVFLHENTGSELRIRWATALKNADYWLREERAFFTIHGTVADELQPGNGTALRLIPATRETYEGSGVQNTLIVAGYVDADGKTFNCDTHLTDGAVWVPIDETGATMYGDVNLDGTRTISDVIALHRLIAEEQTLGAAAYANADCEFDGVLTMADITLMLRCLNGQIEESALGAHEISSTVTPRSGDAEVGDRTQDCTP